MKKKEKETEVIQQLGIPAARDFLGSLICYEVSLKVGLGIPAARDFLGSLICYEVSLKVGVSRRKMPFRQKKI